MTRHPLKMPIGEWSSDDKKRFLEWGQEMALEAKEDGIKK